MSDSTFLKRVEIRNFKSIAHCDVRLGPLNFLVGPNGSGKTNFVDALRFVRDCMTSNFDEALSRQRGTSNRVIRAGADSMNFRLDFSRSGVSGVYEFQIGLGTALGARARVERCRLSDGAYFEIQSGVLFGSSETILSAIPTDRLFLTSVSGLVPFRQVYRALESMKFYVPDPIIAPLAGSGSGDVLDPDGENFAKVFDGLDDIAKKNVEECLRIVAPGLESLRVVDVQGAKILLFRHADAELFATSMSDGTIRALMLLVAVAQQHVKDGQIPLACFEEPETGIHPGALGILLDAFMEASQTTQVIVTSHSPDLLDHKDIPAESLLAVVMDGETRIGPLPEGFRDGIRRRLFTPGGLLRSTQIEPETTAQAS